MPSRQTLQLTIACLVAVAVIAFAMSPVLNNGFVWDDKSYLYNPEYLDIRNWWRILTSHFEISPNYYRPLVIATFLVELKLFGLQPASFHLVNLLLHIANAMLVILLARRLLSQQESLTPHKMMLFAVGAGILYGIHPAMVEATAWISGRFDLLLTFFSLLLLLCDASISRRVPRIVAVFLCFLLAALSKEMAAAMGFVLPAWHLATRAHPTHSLRAYFDSLRAKGDLHVYLAVIAAGLLYLLVRHAVLGYFFLSDPVHALSSPLQRVLLVGKSLGWYAMLVLLPFATLAPIHAEQFPLASTDLLAWVGLGTFLWFAARIAIAIGKGKRKPWLWVAALCSLLPAINLIPLTIADSIVNERFLQFPLAMCCLAGSAYLASARLWHTRSRRLAYGGIAAALSVAFIANCRVTAAVWQDNLTLWYWAALKSPDSGIVISNLAGAYRDRGMIDMSLQLGRRATKIAPAQPAGWIIVGSNLIDLGEYPEGEKYLRFGLKLDPTNYHALNNLGIALLNQGRETEAEAVLMEGLKIAPTNRNLNRNLGVMHLKAGRRELAFKYFSVAYAGISEADMDKAAAKLKDQTSASARTSAMPARPAKSTP